MKKGLLSYVKSDFNKLPNPEELEHLNNKSMIDNFSKSLKQLKAPINKNWKPKE